MKRKNVIKLSLIILTVILTVNVFSITKVCIYKVLANDNNSNNTNINNNSSNNTNSNKVEETTIELFKNKESDNEPFSVYNMFPGDTYTNYYNVKVNYHSNITVHFNVDITSEENIYLADDRPEEDIDTDQDNTNNDNHKLSEVLKVKINVLNLDNNKSKTLYDGLMKDISDDDSSITYDLSSSTSTSSKLRYEIIVYLDTSVNNDYQHKALTADFNWWVEDRKNLEPSDNILWKVVDTGVGIDYIANNTSTYLMINIFLLLLSLSLIIYLRSILYKEDIR